MQDQFEGHNTLLRNLSKAAPSDNPFLVLAMARAKSLGLDDMAMKALSRAVRIAYSSDDPISPKWGARQQAEWESGPRMRGDFRDQASWEGSQPRNRTSGVAIRDSGIEAQGRGPRSPTEGTPSVMGSKERDLDHITDGEKVMDAAGLERKAYAQIRELLSGRQRQSRGLSTF